MYTKNTSSWVFHLFVLFASYFIFQFIFYLKNLQVAFWCEATHYAIFYELLFRSLELQRTKNLYIEMSDVLEKKISFFKFTDK